jgi:ATP-binding cassette subfamily B protein
VAGVIWQHQAGGPGGIDGEVRVADGADIPAGAFGVPAVAGQVPARTTRVDRPLLGRVVALFGPHRRRLMAIGLAVVVASALGVVTPFLTRLAFDDALFVRGGPRLGLLAVLVGLMVVVPLVAAMVGVGETYLTAVLGNRVMAELRNRLFAHLQRMELAFFTATKTGVIQSRLANDVGGVQSVLSHHARRCCRAW